mmetsp:Transcript_3093/g.8514  ORF Transcript_3093/g.8514 Transcript_3093/m.8514 type:complete len:255 (+) Transcript_3093:1624-2388(+)
MLYSWWEAIPDPRQSLDDLDPWRRRMCDLDPKPKLDPRKRRRMYDLDPKLDPCKPKIMRLEARAAARTTSTATATERYPTAFSIILSSTMINSKTKTTMTMTTTVMMKTKTKMKTTTTTASVAVRSERDLTALSIIQSSTMINLKTMTTAPLTMMRLLPMMRTMAVPTSLMTTIRTAETMMLPRTLFLIQSSTTINLKTTTTTMTINMQTTTAQTPKGQPSPRPLLPSFVRRLWKQSGKRTFRAPPTPVSWDVE